MVVRGGQPEHTHAEGADRVGTNLKRFMERAQSLDEAVMFIDEFEEIAGSREQASRVDKSITNEFLKQVPLFKRQARKTLLICATNYIVSWMLHCSGPDGSTASFRWVASTIKGEKPYSSTISPRRTEARWMWTKLSL